jgi:hypothetical protein
MENRTLENWVADDRHIFEIIYTSEKCIKAGGKVIVAFQHALLQIDSFWQTDAPNLDGYITLIMPNGKKGSHKWYNWFDLKICNMMHPGAFRHGVEITVDEEIAVGEEIKLIFGEKNGVKMCPYICDENEIQILHDIDASGEFKYAFSYFNSIIGGKAVRLFVTAPATILCGETADILIRAEDKWSNIDINSTQNVRVYGLPDVEPFEVELEKGIKWLYLPIKQAGIHRVYVETVVDNGAISFKTNSNPIVATDEKPKYGVYWGDLHGHTKHSDGLGKNADYYYEYGRDLVDLDVCATCDHAPRVEARDATKRYNQDGKFVTIWGYEWAESNPGRMDRNFYFRDEECPVPVGIDMPWVDNIKDCWAQIESLYGDNKDGRIIVGPHMFTYQTTAQNWYDSWDDRYDRYIEIYSEHGMSEFYGNPRMLMGATENEGRLYAQAGLKSGKCFGILGSSDNHDSHPGRGVGLHYAGGIVAFLATELTREAIWDAFLNRRFYAATTERIFVDFKIDQHIMGEKFISSESSVSIEITVHTCDERFNAFIIKNGSVIKRMASSIGSNSMRFADELTEDSVYYVRVTQNNGEWAWSSPIYVNKK